MVAVLGRLEYIVYKQVLHSFAYLPRMYISLLVLLVRLLHLLHYSFVVNHEALICLFCLKVLA